MRSVLILLLVFCSLASFAFAQEVALQPISRAAAAAAQRLTVQNLKLISRSDPVIVKQFPMGRGESVARGYDFDSLNELLRSARSILEEPMRPPQVQGLRRFVAAFYPNESAMPSQKVAWYSGGFVNDAAAESAVTRARGVAERIGAMKTIVVDIAVRTLPEQLAAVKIEPEGGGTGHSGTSDTEFKNVYRGLYVYTISKYGMKTISNRLNLVDDSRPVLECRLIADMQPDGPYPCNRK